MSNELKKIKYQNIIINILFLLFPFFFYLIIYAYNVYIHKKLIIINLLA